MKITLSPSQAATLKLAPNEWGRLPDNLSTTALRLAGLVLIRDAPGARTLNRGFQWKVTMAGIRLQGLKITPKTEPEVAAMHKRVVDKGTLA